MSIVASPKEPISTQLTRRFSPYSFDPARTVGAADLMALFEAARWAASSYNAQPWRYIVGVKGRSQQAWQSIHDALVPANQAWAHQAPVLAVGLIRRDFEHNGKPNVAAEHDLGAASASLSFEATHRGLSVHQMIGFDAQKVRDRFDIGDLQPFTALAIGYAGGPAPSEELAERDRKPRVRKPLDELVIAGGF